MGTINIIGNNLKTALDYLSPAVGNKTSAKQEPGLLYLKTIPSHNKILLQVQSDSICAKTYCEPSSDLPDDVLECLVDYSLIMSYVKNNPQSTDFTLDFADIESDILKVTAGKKFIGTIRSVPLDAYEVIEFTETTDLGEVDSSKFNEMLSMTSQFANIRSDSQDFIQIVGEDESINMFAQGDALAAFSMDQELDEDIDITVKASAIKRIKGFSSDRVMLQLTDDGYFFIMKESGQGIRAIVLHSDPPITYQEFNESVEDSLPYSLAWSVDEMDSVLKAVDASSSNGYFNFYIPDASTMVVKTENQQNNSTKMELNIVSSNFDSDLLSEDVFRSSLPLFRKIGILNKKVNKVEVLFNSNDEDYDTPYVEKMQAAGDINGIEYKIAFNVVN